MFFFVVGINKIYRARIIANLELPYTSTYSRTINSIVCVTVCYNFLYNDKRKRLIILSSFKAKRVKSPSVEHMHSQ